MLENYLLKILLCPVGGIFLFLVGISCYICWFTRLLHPREISCCSQMALNHHHEGVVWSALKNHLQMYWHKAGFIKNCETLTEFDTNVHSVTYYIDETCIRKLG